MARPIVFLSDFGLADEFVGVCHGVIARISPDSRVIDLTHSVPPQDVMRGAMQLAGAIRYMPADAVYLAVVDPGVGGARASLAVETGAGNVLIGPDNGLLSLAWEALGDPVRAVDISAPDVILAPVSPTFHGRDVFAPAAAHVAAGGSVVDLGPSVDPADLVTIEIPAPEVGGGSITARVIGVDRFGNVALSASGTDLANAGMEDAEVFDVDIEGSSVTAARVRTFSDVPDGAVALIEDSSGWLTIAVNGGSASESFGLDSGDRARIRPVG